MREYARVSPLFWVKGSGKRLRGDPHAQLLGLYLVTCPAASMIGIYYLPLPTIVHESGLPAEEVSRCLRKCAEVDFAHYDSDAELVWVPNLAHYQLGENLHEADKTKRKGVLNALKPYASHRFYSLFVQKYDAVYGLGLAGAAMPPPGAGGSHEGASMVPEAPTTGPRARAHSPAPVPSPVSLRGVQGGKYGIPDDFALTPERRAYAEMAPLTDVDAVFKKFRHIAIENGWTFDARGWEERWQRFCDDEKGYQRRTRERDRGTGGGAARYKQPPSDWKPGEEERKAEEI